MKEILISADCHELEPPDLFETRLPKGLRDRAARVEFDEAFMHGYFGDRQTFTMSKYIGKDGRFIVHERTVEERERDLAADGIWGELVHTNMGLTAYFADDDLAYAHAQVYNDYIAEVYGDHFDRHKPTAIIPLNDVERTVAEVERVAQMGIKGLMIPSVPPVRYATQGVYDQVWEAAQANGMVACFHIGTGLNLENGMAMQFNEHMDKLTGGGAGDPGLLHATRLRGETQGSRVAQDVIADLVGGGVLARFPDLHFLAIEFNAYWLAGLMEGMDKAYAIGKGQDVSAPIAQAGYYDRNRAADDQPQMTYRFGMNDKWPYDLRPSEYVRRQIHVTFMDDPGAIANRAVTGIEPLLWGADYPHHEGTWPKSQEAIAGQFGGVPDDERSAMLGGTLAKLFDFAVPSAN